MPIPQTPEQWDALAKLICKRTGKPLLEVILAMPPRESLEPRPKQAEVFTWTTHNEGAK